MDTFAMVKIVEKLNEIKWKGNRKSSFNNQISKIDNGLTNIEKIRDWIIENKILES